MGISKRTSSSMVYFLTQTRPLTEDLLENALNQKNSINLSFDLDMEQLPIITNRKRQPLEPYNAEKEVPNEFLQKWQTKNILRLPARFKYRRNLAMEMIDGYHWKNCGFEECHMKPNEKCWCKTCGYTMEHLYHECTNLSHPLLLLIDSLT